MRLLILQHAWVDAPGVLDATLSEDGHECRYVHLDEGEASPLLTDVDAVWVLGGPMDVDDEQRHPWLRREKAVIREAVLERGLPYVGICLGHQLLVDALGGRCADLPTAEIGVYPIELTEAGRTSGLFDGFGDSPFQVLQNHTTHVVQVPEGCSVLAGSARCPVQALARGPTVATVQFHLETPPERALGWLDDDRLADELLASPGLVGAADPAAVLREHVERGNRRAASWYRAWLERAGSADL